MATQNATFWFDPACPWAWLTSRWIKEVQTQRDLTVSWKVMSLGLLNKDREGIDESYRQRCIDALGPVRILTKASLENGPDILDDLYTTIGALRHVEGNTDMTDVMTQTLAKHNLPAEWLDYATSEDVDTELAASHNDALTRVGQDVGTPVIAIGDTAFFGPVVSPAPKGEEAAKLWDGIVTAASYPGFFELKRSRTVGPIFD